MTGHHTDNYAIKTFCQLAIFFLIEAKAVASIQSIIEKNRDFCPILS